MNTLFCMLQVTKCNSPKLGVNLAAKRACPKTCGSCTPCTYEQKKCESEKTCFDKSPQWCQFALKGKCSEASSHGLVVRKHCRVTCEECRPCKAPPVYQAPPCSNDCEDLRDDCPRLATEMRYCTYPDYTDWMQSNCKLSCGLCKKCRAPPKLPSLISAPPAPPQGYKPTPTPTDEPISTYSPEDVYAILSELYGNDTDNGTSITKKKFGPENTLQYEVKRECKQYKIQMQASLQEQCLAAHNYYRCLHNVPELEYDDILATSAYSYAIKMANDGMYGAASVKPSLVGIDREQDVGENIAWQMNRYNQFNIYQAVSGWYAEGLNYDHENPGYNDKTSHFTQLVWKGSSKVGCGLKKRGNEIYIVAHYQAAGNVPMKFPANVKPPKNACKAQCSSGRCQGNNAEKSTCNCGQGRQYDAPVCTGGCVAFCPKPYGYRGMWKERCAGSVSCTCLKPGYGYGRRFGATCR
uniref:Uncharacterized protein LOC100180998 n=1 Tax=Phallusia mammillata TaxID=59560 RepID=A0A6F9DI16_9ASCI|nr:uncharacterized protein LOC100180998 [Phallusia mammillata]